MRSITGHRGKSSEQSLEVSCVRRYASAPDRHLPLRPRLRHEVSTAVRCPPVSRLVLVAGSPRATIRLRPPRPSAVVADTLTVCALNGHVAVVSIRAISRSRRGRHARRRRLQLRHRVRHRRGEEGRRVPATARRRTVHSSAPNCGAALGFKPVGLRRVTVPFDALDDRAGRAATCSTRRSSSRRVKHWSMQVQARTTASVHSLGRSIHEAGRRQHRRGPSRGLSSAPCTIRTAATAASFPASFRRTEPTCTT